VITTNVSIPSCKDVPQFANTLLSGDGFTCECIAGFEPAINSSFAKCEQCPLDNFKPEVDDTACNPCPFEQDSNGIVGATVCVCKSGMFSLSVLVS